MFYENMEEANPLQQISDFKSKEDIMGAEHDRIMGIANSFPM